MAMVAAVAVVACGGKGVELSSDKTARGLGYEFPVPNGYAIALAKEFDPLVKAGGVVLAQKAGGDPRMRASIVVAPIEGNIGFDVSDEAACKTFAEAGAKSVSTALLEVKVIDVGTGETTHKTCQWRVRGSDAGKNHEAMATVMSAGPRVYVVTCNYVPGDRMAMRACAKVVQTWKVILESGGS